MLSESLLGVATQALLQKVGGGRVAALEILVATPAVRNLIREDKTFQIPSAMQIGARAGMVTMEAALADLVSSGLITTRQRARASRRAGRSAACVGARRCPMSVPDSEWDPLLRDMLDHMVSGRCVRPLHRGAEPAGFPDRRHRLPGEEGVRRGDDRADGRLADDAGPAPGVPRQARDEPRARHVERGKVPRQHVPPARRDRHGRAARAHADQDARRARHRRSSPS